MVWALSLLIMGATFYVDLHIPLAALIGSFLQPLWAMPGIVLVCSILTIIGIFYSPQPLVVPFWKVLTNRGLALFAMWIIAILLYHRNALITPTGEALARIQLLEGLLPICAECKKNSRPGGQVASTGNLSLRSLQRDVYPWHLPGM